MVENPSAWRATKIATIGTGLLVAVCAVLYFVMKFFDWLLGPWGFPALIILYAFTAIWIVAFRART